MSVDWERRKKLLMTLSLNNKKNRPNRRKDTIRQLEIVIIICVSFSMTSFEREREKQTTKKDAHAHTYFIENEQEYINDRSINSRRELLCREEKCDSYPVNNRCRLLTGIKCAHVLVWYNQCCFPSMNRIVSSLNSIFFVSFRFLQTNNSLVKDFSLN